MWAQVKQFRLVGGGRVALLVKLKGDLERGWNELHGGIRGQVAITGNVFSIVVQNVVVHFAEYRSQTGHRR